MVANRSNAYPAQRPSAPKGRTADLVLQMPKPAFTTNVQQLTRNVFADVNDIENFYSIELSPTRVSRLKVPLSASLTR